jgi:hypothetical protein
VPTLPFIAMGWILKLTAWLMKNMSIVRTGKYKIIKQITFCGK